MGLTEEDQTAVVAQVERILQSEAFRSSNVLRRLLAFLLAKFLSGEADQLKEYSVAVEGLGKPESFDPSQESIVRIHMGRLRLKLENYYRTEGQDDLWLIQFPKRRFTLTCERRTVAVVEEIPFEAMPIQEPSLVEPLPSRSPWSTLTVRAVLLGLTVLWGLTALAWWHERQLAVEAQGRWSPEMEQVWGPMVSSQRALIVSLSDSLFASFDGSGVYGRIGLIHWDDFLESSDVRKVQRALQNSTMKPSYYFSPASDAIASFLLGKSLGPHVADLSLVRSNLLSWQQLADNNVVFIGGGYLFADRFAVLPVDLDLEETEHGYRNLHPAPGEPGEFVDQTGTGFSEDGEVYAVITHVPGPLGTNDIMTFTSPRMGGRLAAVRWLTQESSVRSIVQTAEGYFGSFPRYYQILLKVRYKDSVPLETSYVLIHQLQLKPMVNQATHFISQTSVVERDR